MTSTWTAVMTWNILLGLLLLFQVVSTIRMVDLRVPTHVVRNNPVRLECHYDLEKEALYSVKWYKDGKEFYRFLPGDHPPSQVFDQPGVIVDLPNSSDTAVSLKGVDYQGSGVYKCEVSGEAPSFRTVSDWKQMQVVDLPKEGPHIEGGQVRYAPGEYVRVNCSSSKSTPPATLSWFINGEPADDMYVRRYPSQVDELGLETVVLGLEFKVRSKHFLKGDLKLKCLATIAQLYWRSNEQSVQGDRIRLPPLEQRDAFGHEAEASSHSSNGGGSRRRPSSSIYSYCYAEAPFFLMLISTYYYNIRMLQIS